MNASRPPRRRLRAPIEPGLTTGLDEDPRSAAFKQRRHGLASNDDRSAIDTAPRYAELHCLSSFSFQRGASSARELFERARKLGYGALAITDECSLAGIVRALEASTETKVPLIVGTEVQLADGPKLVLLARDQAGYTDLCRLITTGRRRSAKGEYHLTCADAEQLGEGVLVLWAAGAAHSPKIGLDIDDGTANVTAAAAAGPAPSPQPSPPTKEPLGEREHVALRSSPLRKDVPCASQQLKPSPPSPLGGEGWVRGPASEVSPAPTLEAGSDLEHRAANVAAAVGPAPSPQPSPPTMRLSGERGYGALRSRAPSRNDASGTPQRLQSSPPTKEPFGEREASWLARHFASRAWIAVELHRGPGDDAVLAALRALGARHGLPLVASGDVHMHVRRRRALQDVMTAIRLGCRVAEAGHALFPNGERHLRRIDDLAALYPADLLAETLRIAALCTFDLRRLDYRYPQELVPAGLSAIEHLRALAWAGAARLWPGRVPEGVRAQVERELALIAELGYEHFFLTVEDIVRWARAQDPPILCQGRGSSANSAVCYCLGITAVSPETGNLLFERFLSKERDEPPDIDVDFEHERREEVIQYIFGKYGRERAALAATVISYRSRSAVRDVGRALGVPDDQLDRLGGLFSRVRSGQPFDAALRERGFDPASRLLQRLFALAGELHGFPRHLSQHVGGFVISEQPLHHLVPVENAAMPARTIIQWDKDDLETMKLLKVDVLALGMLTALRKCLELLHAHGLWTHPYAGARPLLHDIPQHDDAAVYDMICRADTVGVFQIESRAQMSMLPRLKPRCFYDLVVEVAIVRPGPIQGDMVHPYLRRRQGLEPIDYPQSRFERASGSGASQVREALGRTLGVPIFQEQVMKLIQVVAGFTPGEADELRRAMAAWKRRGGLEHFRERIQRGMRERGYEDAYFERIFQQIQGFGEYGFPESHAASFALLAWASSWLKHYHPAAFTCALLNAQPMGFYQPSQLIQDAQRHGVTVRPVDVTASTWDCTLELIKPSPPGLLGGEGWVRGRGAEGNVEQVLRRHARERGHPLKTAAWIPAFAGMTTSSENPEVSSSPTLSTDLPFDHGAANPAPSPQPAPPTKEPSGERGHTTPAAVALRLGLRQIRGLSEDLAGRLIAARTVAPFRDVADLTRRARVNAAERARLADAGALRSLSGHRHRARWDSAGAELPTPLLEQATVTEARVALRRPSLREDVMTDYATLGLSLRAHPLALVREELTRRRVVPAGTALDPANRGRPLRCAGLVTVRQHPGTAKGVTFVTLEDETGQVNVVVWRALAERQHRVLLEATLMAVDGVLEASDGVHHLIARRLHDYSALLPEFAFASRDFH